MESFWYENFAKFRLVREFVFSIELEQEVALAELSENKTVLIDVFGNIIEEVNEN